MSDKEELLFFLRDCIRDWELRVKAFIPDNSTKTWFTKMLKSAKDILKEHKLLYHYDITIKVPMRITGGMMNQIGKNLERYLSGYGAEITLVESLIADDRVLLQALAMCKGCKWLRNEECWYNEEYYDSDFPIDCDRYEKEC